MTTKQKVLMAALTLFSEKGYSAVYVEEIATAVGIKPPSLYKHFKSKQDIFDSCIDFFSKRMDDIHDDMHLPETDNPGFTYQTVSVTKLIEVTTNLFLFYWQDEVAGKFRKMLMIERYHNPQLNNIFESLFIYGAIQHEEKIFAELIEKGIIKGTSPYLMALRFYSPLFLLLQKYDMHPDKINDVKVEIAMIVQEFCDTYQSGNG